MICPPVSSREFTCARRFCRKDCQVANLSATQYPLQPYDSIQAGVIVNDVFGVAINWFVNRTPLITRSPKLPVGSPTFLFTNDNYRPRSQTLGTAYTAAGTSLVFSGATGSDATVFDLGDVLQIDSEHFLVTATASANGGTTTLTVTPGYAGTTTANHASGAIVYLITNTRTGAELNIAGLSREPFAVTQSCQTVQHAYQVG